MLYAWYVHEYSMRVYYEFLPGIFPSQDTITSNIFETYSPTCVPPRPPAPRNALDLHRPLFWVSGAKKKGGI